MGERSEGVGQSKRKLLEWVAMGVQARGDATGSFGSCEWIVCVSQHAFVVVREIVVDITELNNDTTNTSSDMGLPERKGRSEKYPLKKWKTRLSHLNRDNLCKVLSIPGPSNTSLKRVTVR